jgi:hypothetical protein
MNAAYKNILLAAAVLFSGCGMYMKAPTGTPQSPPFPATPSILPLAVENQWNYSYTAYDSLGIKINPSRITLVLKLAGGYGLVNDTQLVAITWQNYQQNFPAYVYKYEWDNLDSGALVVHRGAYPLGSRGLYVIGWYRHGETHLFPQEKLWLAYPADSGKTWTYNPDSANDSASAVTMEILSTHARFFVPNPGMMTAGAFYECYLYKETSNGWESYYYYNPDIGCVGYLSYCGGKLRASYYLKLFKG